MILDKDIQKLINKSMNTNLTIDNNKLRAVDAFHGSYIEIECTEKIELENKELNITNNTKPLNIIEHFQLDKDLKKDYCHIKINDAMTFKKEITTLSKLKVPMLFGITPNKSNLVLMNHDFKMEGIKYIGMELNYYSTADCDTIKTSLKQEEYYITNMYNLLLKHLRSKITDMELYFCRNAPLNLTFNYKGYKITYIQLFSCRKENIERKEREKKREKNNDE